MGYRWKPGEVRAYYLARQRHLTKKLIDTGAVRPRPQSCERCGQSPGRGAFGQSLVQMHHLDYERPELIEWLCPSCHANADHAQVPDLTTWDDLTRWDHERA